MQNQKSIDVSETFSFLSRDDWKASQNVAILKQFDGCTSILKVRGHPNRADFLYLSDEPGFLTLYRWDPEKRRGKRILLDDEPITDSSINGDFALHPCAPWAIYTQDTKGDQNCTIYTLNYLTGEKTELVRSIGTVDFLVPCGDNAVIAVVGTLDDRRVIELSYEGRVRELFKTEQQILSIAVSEKHGLLVIPVGRRTTELLVIDVESGAVKRRISETATSKESCLTINDQAGYLAYATNAQGDMDEIVVRSLETFEPVQRVPVPGEVGFFVLDSKFMEWYSPRELLVVVAKHARCSLLRLDLEERSWSAPLIENTAAFLTKTKHGVYWVSSDFSYPGFIQGYREAKLETVIPSSFEDTSLVVESLWYPAYDGRQIQGWLMKNTTNPQAPLIVMCHGGPTWAIVNEWGEAISQVLVRAGYHVFQPNFRGSTTFGTTFTNMNVGDVGGGDLEDVLYGARAVSASLGLEAKPIILGASYGGYLTLQALTTQPDEWAGGVAIVPITDFEAVYYLSDAHYRRFNEHFFGGPPEREPDLYRERSPITHLENLTRPVLIIAGKNDPSAPFSPVETFYKTAQALGKPVYLMAEDSGHGVSSTEFLYKTFVNSMDFCEKLRETLPKVSGGWQSTSDVLQ